MNWPVENVGKRDENKSRNGVRVEHENVVAQTLGNGRLVDGATSDGAAFRHYHRHKREHFAVAVVPPSSRHIVDWLGKLRNGYVWWLLEARLKKNRSGQMIPYFLIRFLIYYNIYLKCSINISNKFVNEFREGNGSCSLSLRPKKTINFCGFLYSNINLE